MAVLTQIYARMVRGRRWRGRLILAPSLGIAVALVPLMAEASILSGVVVRFPPGAGAQQVGATAYSIPTGARFVSNTGSDTSPGTKEAPWRTLAKAAAAAPGGATVVLRGGTYRETTRFEQRITLQPYPDEAVWLDGSDVVTGWVADGTSWRKDGWKVRFDREDYHPSHYNPDYPLAPWPDQVFVNGIPLTEVSARSAVKTGTFFVDYATSRLYIGSNPTGTWVTASARAEALRIGADGSVVRGLGVRRYANTAKQLGVLKVIGKNVLLENNVITDSSAVGLTVQGTQAIIRHNTVSKNGLLGIHADGATNALVENNLVTGNNAQRFQAGSNEGGVKFTRSHNVRISGNRSEANLGQGLWLDVDSDYGTVVRNLVRNNSRNGIQVELSDDAIVASNVVQGSGGNGVYVLESARASVWNNTLVDNQRNIIAMDGLRPALLQTVTIRNNVASGGRGDTISLVGVIDANKQRTGSQMGVTVNRNAYYRSSTTQPDLLLVWAAGSSGNLLLRTLADVRAATGQELGGMYAQGASNPFVTAPGADDYGRPADSAALGAGASLPWSIANAIGGVSGGSPVDIGVLVLG